MNARLNRSKAGAAPLATEAGSASSRHDKPGTREAHDREEAWRERGGPVSRPPARDLAAARARLSAVTDWLAAREGSGQPGSAAVDAAASILAAPPARRDVSVSMHPATVHRVQGHLVAVYHLGPHGGPVATGECSCAGEGLCEHLLVALAGTRQCQGGRRTA